MDTIPETSANSPVLTDVHVPEALRGEFVEFVGIVTASGDNEWPSQPRSDDRCPIYENGHGSRFPITGADLRGRGRGRGFECFSRTPENPENGVSDVPDFTFFPRERARGPPRFSQLWCSEI